MKSCIKIKKIYGWKEFNDKDMIKMKEDVIQEEEVSFKV